MNKNPLTKNELIDFLKNISLAKLESEKVELSEAEGRILSSDIISSINLPPFNNSAVDGYAIHDDNLCDFIKLKCTKRVAAGDQTKISLKTNEVARIFTGACMPINSNTVIMQENTSIDGDYKLPATFHFDPSSATLTYENIIGASASFLKVPVVFTEGWNFSIAEESLSKTTINLLA